MKYNTPCPGHNHHCWTHRHLMREDDIVCTTCYKRLPDEFKRMSWQLKLSDMHPTTAKSKLSIIVDWLLEHPLQDDVDCYKAQEERADKRLKEESLGLTDSWVD